MDEIAIAIHPNNQHTKTKLVPKPRKKHNPLYYNCIINSIFIFEWCETRERKNIKTTRLNWKKNFAITLKEKKIKQAKTNWSYEPMHEWIEKKKFANARFERLSGCIFHYYKTRKKNLMTLFLFPSTSSPASPSNA